MLAAALAITLASCRIERIAEGTQGASLPAADTPAGIAEPLAWSRDVAVIAAVEPPNQPAAFQQAVRRLSRELCEKLTLQGDVDAAWHAAVMQIEHELSARGYLASEALLSSSDGRWGASVLAARHPSDQHAAKVPQSRLMETAWHYWERGSGLQVLPELASDAAAPVAEAIAPVTNKTAPSPVIEDPSRNWVQDLPVAPEEPEPLPIDASHAPAATAAPDEVAARAQPDTEADADAGVELPATEASPARALHGRHAPDDHEVSKRPQSARVALLVRLSDGSFRGTWLSGTEDPNKLDAVVRDAVIGERLFVGVLGAVFALDQTGLFLEPRAASRAYERLLQPGTGKAPATVVLTSATLEIDERPGVFALSSRGAQAGACRAIQQESAL